MSFVRKIILPGAALSALFFTACGGGDTPAEASQDAPKEVAELTIPSDPAVAIETIAKELASGNGGILWKAMPASYQTDLNEIAKLAGTKVDAELYDKSFSLLGRLVEVCLLYTSDAADD